MIFHENRLKADDSHELSYPIFFRKLGKISKKLSSAGVVIGALWVNIRFYNLGPSFKKTYKAHVPNET